jgi:hypothetical protein
MLEQLIKLVQQNANDDIVANQAVPNEFNNAVIQDIATQIFSGLHGQATKGNMHDIMSMFQSNGSALTGNPVVSQLILSITGDLANKFGVSRSAASGIANSLIPTVMDQLIKKTNDPDDNDFDIQDVVKNVTGKSDVSDILSQFTSNKQSGALESMVGNLFK